MKLLIAICTMAIHLIAWSTEEVAQSQVAAKHKDMIRSQAKALLSTEQHPHLDMYLDMLAPEAVPPAPIENRRRKQFCQQLKGIPDLNALKDPALAATMVEEYGGITQRAAWLHKQDSVSIRGLGNVLKSSMAENFPLVWMVAHGKFLCGAWFQSLGEPIRLDADWVDLEVEPPKAMTEAETHKVSERLVAKIVSETNIMFPTLNTPESGTNYEYLSRENEYTHHLEEDYSTASDTGPLCETLQEAIYDLNHVHESEVVDEIRERHLNQLTPDKKIHIPGRYNRFAERKTWAQHYPLLWVVLQTYENCPHLVYTGGYYTHRPIEH